MALFLTVGRNELLFVDLNCIADEIVYSLLLEKNSSCNCRFFLKELKAVSACRGCCSRISWS